MRLRRKADMADLELLEPIDPEYAARLETKPNGTWVVTSIAIAQSKVRNLFDELEDLFTRARAIDEDWVPVPGEPDLRQPKRARRQLSRKLENVGTFFEILEKIAAAGTALYGIWTLTAKERAALVEKLRSVADNVENGPPPLPNQQVDESSGGSNSDQRRRLIKDMSAEGAHGLYR